MPRAASAEVILIVEDEDQVRAMTVETLQELGYIVLAARSGAEALQHIAERSDIALMFTDVVMAGMNGRQLADAARARRPDLKILFTTGYTRNAIVHHGRLDDDVALLQKPFAAAELARAIRRELDG